MTEDKRLTLMEFLDTVGAPLDSPESWYETWDLWDEYAAKLNPPRNSCITDWSEVGPALRILAAMIRANLFKEEPGVRAFLDGELG